MSSLEPFLLRIKPAMDTFLLQANVESLNKLENELAQFNWMHMNIFNIQILVPLILKLDELSNENQELRTGCLQCITLVTSKVYLKELTALRTMLVVVLKQIRQCDKAAMRANVSEELKLAAVHSMTECLRRSTTDVLEQFYCKDSSMILGQILLTLVDLIEYEKYKKLVIASLECLMVVFYVHDGADRLDVVLRNQVANILFIFLPKIVTILYRTTLADDKIGETIKINSIKALGRILCVIYEETMEDVIHAKYDVESFKKLISASHTPSEDFNAENDILAVRKNREQLETRMKQMQGDGRTSQWIKASSKKLRVIFMETSILRSHTSTKIRKEYADICCLLIENCAHNLKENFVFMLENVVAFTEDDDVHISQLCRNCIDRLQQRNLNASMFDEYSELLFDEHLTKLPRIIQRCDDAEQYTEFMFLRGFLKSLSANKLQLLLSIPQNLEKFCMCLLSALDLNISISLLVEEYSLRDIDIECDYVEASKLPWRSFKNINSERCIKCLQDICYILGRIPVLNRIITDYLIEMIQQQSPAINEILLTMMWLSTAKEKDQNFRYNDLDLAKQLLDELLDDKHWHLSLESDTVTKIKDDKPMDWFVDRTPGLYESAVEIRTQDCDSDDETEDICRDDRVTIADAEFNVLHTCIVMDCLGHCCLYVGERFDSYVFQTLHKVLLKLAHSNVCVYRAANFALVSMQKALRYNKINHLIESHTDYITYHLNTLLKKTPDSKSAVDILTVVLQFSSRSALPHLESIFLTIYGECSKAYQTQNVISYLKVFYGFLRHIASWLLACSEELQYISGMQTEDSIIETNGCDDILTSWLELLNNTQSTEDCCTIDSSNESISIEESIKNNSPDEAGDLESTEKSLPRHVEMIKAILQQVVKFINSSDQRLPILSIECLTCGLPLLRNYENVMLPLVHSIWSPLVEKFRQRNALVLNRCFSLMGVLATCAKDFITKRSLDDVIPFLKRFLQKAAQHSAKETVTVKTQEYKLQLKLLQEFPNLIVCLDLDGKHLNAISEIVSLYLSKEQPKELQKQAIYFYTKLRSYNGPLMYLSIFKKSHLKLYEDNVKIALLAFSIK